LTTIGIRGIKDKKKVGMYHSTPLYEFAMRCGNIVAPEDSADGSAHCNQRFVIRTDPKNDDYELAEGLVRKVETWDSKDSETIELVDPETRRQMNLDPMFKAEKTIRDKQREKTEKQRLADLQELQDERQDAYSLNCILRRANRTRRKEEKAREEEERLNGKPNFGLALAPASEEDRTEAKAVKYWTDHDKIDIASRRSKVLARPVLGKKKKCKWC